jgi:hypothetical protein
VTPDERLSYLIMLFLVIVIPIGAGAIFFGLKLMGWI